MKKPCDKRRDVTWHLQKLEWLTKFKLNYS